MSEIFEFEVKIKSWENVESVLKFSRLYFIEFSKALNDDLNYDQCLDNIFYGSVIPISNFIAGYEDEENGMVEFVECDIFNYIKGVDEDLNQTIITLKNKQ